MNESSNMPRSISVNHRELDRLRYNPHEDPEQTISVLCKPHIAVAHLDFLAWPQSEQEQQQRQGLIL